MNWLTENKDALLVFASFLGAASAIVAAWTLSEAQKRNRRALIRERLVGDFRVAMCEFLALADRTLNPSHRSSSESHWEDSLNFSKTDNAIEILILGADEKLLEEFRDAIQDMKFAYSNCEGEFEARSKVISLAKRIVREQLALAREGK